jgi:hypothetical protein
MSSQTTVAKLPVGQIGFGAMRITGPGIWDPPKNDDGLLDAVSCKSVIVRAAIDVDRLAGDETAILAD